MPSPFHTGVSVDHPGVAGKFFSALGKARVNIRAIAQGSSERNISTVIDSADSRRALRAVHAAFYLSNQKEAHEYMERQEHRWDEVRQRIEQSPSPTVERLRAVRQAGSKGNK